MPSFVRGELSAAGAPARRAGLTDREIATELVATRAELEALLADVVRGTVDESRHRLLRGWRRDLAGEAVLALAEGRVAVRAADRPPYVEQIRL